MPEDKDSKTSSRTLESSDSAGIKALVQSFRVCWDVCPAEILVKNAIPKIGFDLELFGTPECGTEHVDPGCQHCLRVESALREIADSILPRVNPTCKFDVDSEGRPCAVIVRLCDRWTTGPGIRI